MKKIIFIAPHLSTGGLPQYLVKKIETLKNELEIFCIEYENITGGVLVVQRNRIESLLDKNHFLTLGENKKEELRALIDKINPDFIHLEEIPEYFLSDDIAEIIYTKDRKYKLFETSHDSSFDPDKKKKFLPDAFLFVSNWQIEQYKNIDVPKFLAEYPIEYKQRPDRVEGLLKLGLDPNKKHILNVGLFTPRKNQAEIFDLAKEFDDSVQFHFLGNQADNFKFYWEPLLKNIPSNCKVWGERNDTDNFYSCMDLFLFTSRGQNGDKETMPLVLRESIGWNIPILLYNLDVYQNYFDKFSNINYLKDKEYNIELIKNKLSFVNTTKIESIYNDSDELLNIIYNEFDHKFDVICSSSSELKDKKLTLILKDNYNLLTNFTLDFVYQPNYAFWFSSNASKYLFNGFLIQVIDKNNNNLYFEREIKNINNQEKFIPKVGNNEIIISHDDLDHSSWFTYYEVYIKKEYKGIKKGDVVLDIGSNLGFLSLYALDQGASKIYSIEPEPKNFENLKKNTSQFKEITPIQYAIDYKKGEIDFYVGDSSSIHTIFEQSENVSGYKFDHNTIKVKTIDADSLIKEFNIEKIDYLKIDCEGGEYAFFETIDENYLKNKVKFITGEVHAFAGSHNDYVSKIKNKLIKCGFKVEEDRNLDIDSILIFKAEKNPKIKIVHLLNNVDSEREKSSIKSLKKLTNCGLYYQQIINPLYKEKPPVENCNRPSQVSELPGDYLLGPGHYGCYLSHRQGILEGLNDDVDAILLNECDSILQFSEKEMSETILRAYEYAKKYNLAYVSFGKKIPDIEHEQVENDFYITSTLSEAHCILILKDKYEYFKEKFETTPWDVSDLWYNCFINDFKKGIFSRPYSLQYPSVSNIDYKFKDGYILHEKNSLPVNFENNDISVVIQTCDKYKFLWKGWYYSFKNNWDWSLNWDVYFCNEQEKLNFSDSRIKQINSKTSMDSSGFSDRLIEILQQIKTKYILYIQDDMWLYRKIDKKVFEDSLYIMKHFNWNCLKIHEKTFFNYDLEKTNFFINDIRVLKQKINSEYLLSHNACFWNLDFLLENMSENESPWKNEFEGTKRISQNYDDPKIYHLDYPWYYQYGIARNGEFTQFGVELNDLLKHRELNKTIYDL